MTPNVAHADVKNDLPMPNAKQTLGHDRHTVAAQQVQSRFAIALPYVHSVGVHVFRKHIPTPKNLALAL